MGEVIEHDDSGEPGLVRVGQAQTQVSLKVYQDIYHQVTGRTEQIRKRYSQNLLLEFSELEQLHYKVMQLCDVHRVVAHSESITVFHSKERKEQFTSFERFRTYNGNTASPTVSIVLKYNFSIIPAELEHPQEYVVSIRLTSRVATIKQMEDDAPPFMQGHFFGFLAGNTAEVSVDYADYVIARGFLEAFDEWMSGCKVTPKSPLLACLRAHSHRIPGVAQLVLAMVIVWFALRAVPTFFTGPIDPGLLARFFIVYTGGAYILITLVGLTAHLAESAIDTFPEMSYLKLNKGDEKLIEESQSAKPKAITRLVLGALGAIILGIISAKLERLV